MAKSNLLRPLATDNTGTFYTFSQWGEDLTLQNALGDAYRIVPSRFACFNLDSPGDAPDILQNTFEHKCAAYRYFLDHDTTIDEKFNPKHASILFWEALENLGVTIGNENNNSSMVYVGEMDIQGTNYIDGVTYSEMYCIVPTNGKRMNKWEVASDQKPTPPEIEFSNSHLEDGYPFRWTSQSWPSGAAPHGNPVNESLKLYYDGPAVLTCEDNQTRYSSLNTLDSLHKVYMQDILYSGNYFKVDDTAPEFYFNSIALFYDIVAKDEHNDYHYIYTAVPMGMYFLNEPIKKVVTNDDIYGQGTSYGLRVTSKFCSESLVPQAGENYSGANVTASVEEIYPELASVMDRFNAAAEALDDYTDKIQNSIEQMNTHLSQFKDNRVNVPYIREIKGVGDEKPEKYWFVNGRSTGVKVDGETTSVIYYNGSGSGGDELMELIQQIIEGSVNNYIDSSIYEYIDESVSNQVTNINPTQVIQQGNFIRLIPPTKYTGNTAITEVPNIEDYQDLYGNNPKGMFNGCTKLERIPRLELSNATDCSEMFKDCKKLSTIIIEDTYSCEDFSNLCNGCTSLKTLAFDATSATSITNAFLDCNELVELKIKNIDPTKIHTIDLSNLQNLSYSSLEYIINNMKSQEWEDSFDTAGPTAQVTMYLPTHLSYQSRSVMDLVYNAQMNKNIKIIIG